MLLLGQFVDFVEFVHVELPDKRREVPMSEEIGQNLLLELLPILDKNLVRAIPAHKVRVLLGLNVKMVT